MNKLRLRFTSWWKMYKVPLTINKALSRIFPMRLRLIIDSFVDLGGFLSTSGSTGSTPRLCAGGPSMIMLIHRICMAFRGLGKWNMVENAIRDKAEMLLFEEKMNKAIILFMRLWFDKKSVLRAELKANKVSNVVIDSFTFLDS